VRRRRLFAGVSAAAALALATGVSATASSVSAVSEVIPNYLVSAIAIDQADHTATLPLYHGEVPGLGRVWFILTESSNLADAERLGINWAPKLANALGTPAVQQASLEEGGGHSQFNRDSDVWFPAGVNFSGHRLIIPGPNLFPLNPASHAGPVGYQGYSPLFTFGDGVVFNGAEVANRTGVHPKVASLDLRKREAVMHLTQGFYLGRNVLYLSTESSVTQIAALENATYAPRLAAVPQAGSDDPSLSAREAIIPIVNGPVGASNPQRQGLQSVVLGEGDPLSIIREEPECSDPADPPNCSALQYSPMWDAEPVAWTQAAIDAGLRTRLTSHEQVEALFNQGLLVNAAPDGPVNTDPEIYGLRAAGIVINCPPIFVAPPA
jgi:hypothetical protein